MVNFNINRFVFSLSPTFFFPGNETILMRMPSQLYSRERTIGVKTVFTTIEINQYIQVLPVQLVRIRTTDSVWGFSIFNMFGNHYQEEFTVNYLNDNPSK